MVSDRLYWSNRRGRGPKGDPSISDLYRSVALAGLEMSQRDFLQEWYGYSCVDAGEVKGRAAVDLPTHIETVLGYRDAWPLEEDPMGFLDDVVSKDEYETILETAEDRIFDIIEFLHDHISAGVEEPGAFHSYSGCGWHYQSFDARPAQELFRSRINSILSNYRGGYRLAESGEVQHSAPTGLEQLIETPLLTDDQEIRSRVEAAVTTYRSRNRTPEEQRDAVRNLFDVLERLRPTIKVEMLRGDESDLFTIANNFSIRHLNENQKGSYDSAVWFSWLFYVNLATVHLLTRIRSRNPS